MEKINFNFTKQKFWESELLENNVMEDLFFYKKKQLRRLANTISSIQVLFYILSFTTVSA